MSSNRLHTILLWASVVLAVIAIAFAIYEYTTVKVLEKKVIYMESEVSKVTPMLKKWDPLMENFETFKNLLPRLNQLLQAVPPIPQ